MPNKSLTVDYCTSHQEQPKAERLLHKSGLSANIGLTGFYYEVPLTQKATEKISRQKVKYFMEFVVS